ncbi:MAG: hypothetical protein WD887_00805, partial [Candidatus Saccharimonadales bacterium]
TSGPITSGLVNGQTISSAANFTGTVNAVTGYKVNGAGTTGTILRGNGTNYIASTATFADTYTASNLLYSNGANTVTGLATGNNGVLITSGTGVPSISSTIPTATQDNITRTGALVSGSIASGFGTISTGNNITTTALGTFGNLLINGSSTLQNFTFLNATGTSATTTSFFAGTASSTNLFSSLLSVGGSALNVIAGGNVGIGTLLPNSALNVSYSNTATTYTADGGRGLEIINTNTTNNNLAELAFRTLDTGGALGSGASIAAVFTNHAESTITADLAFMTNPSVGEVLTERMRITSEGQIGIGTTTPASRLAVSGGASIGANYNFAAPTNGLIVEGNVGIGTTSP